MLHTENANVWKDRQWQRTMYYENNRKTKKFEDRSWIIHNLSRWSEYKKEKWSLTVFDEIQIILYCESLEAREKYHFKSLWRASGLFEWLIWREKIYDIMGQPDRINLILHIFHPWWGRSAVDWGMLWDGRKAIVYVDCSVCVLEIGRERERERRRERERE